jgi:Cu-Zn family superoxide dismutase
MNVLRRIAKQLTILLVISFLALIYIALQGSSFSLKGKIVLGQAAIATPLAQAVTGQATLTDPSGSTSLKGEVSFSQTDTGVKVEATFTDVPGGYHGFHVHENGSCANNGNAAGGHFNPDQVKHGNLLVDGFADAHAGDFGNILARANGTASFSQTFPGLTLTDGKYAIANHAIILHANRDDYSQPTGNAGGRIGCGLITPD